MKSRKDVFDGREVGVKIKMLTIDIGDHRDGWRKLEK